MKTRCWNSDVVKRYRILYAQVQNLIDNGEIELGEDEGSLNPDRIRDFENFILGYETASGKGLWYIDARDEDNEKLIFEGNRNSFIRGSSLLQFQPERIDGWEVMESSHKDRGAFEDKIDYYLRKKDKWLVKDLPNYIRMFRAGYYLMKDKLFDIQNATMKKKIALSKSSSSAGTGVIIFDERDIKPQQVKKFLTEDLQDDVEVRFEEICNGGDN